MQRAFTSLEVLCATALAAMMMTAVLGVLGGLARHERAVTKTPLAPPWQERLLRQLERDFEQARSIEPLVDGFAMTGPLATDAVTTTPTWLDARVVYRVVLQGDESLMLREEFGAASEPRRQLLCVDVFRVEVVEAEALDSVPGIGGESLMPQAAPLPKGPIPGKILVRLWKDSQHLLLQRTVINPGASGR